MELLQETLGEEEVANVAENRIKLRPPNTLLLYQRVSDSRVTVATGVTRKSSLNARKLSLTLILIS